MENRIFIRHDDKDRDMAGKLPGDLKNSAPEFSDSRDFSNPSDSSDLFPPVPATPQSGVPEECALVSPSATLAILLGASRWDKWDDLDGHEAFANSAGGLEDYLLKSFGLPPENIRNLFDSRLGPDGLDEAIGAFLEKRIRELKQSGTAATDLVIYYTGHGNFQLGNENFFLALRNTRQYREEVSALGIKTLASALRDRARYMRRYLILDCCFAGAADRYLQSGSPIDSVAVKTMDAFKETPGKGTALLCSSSSKTPSLISPDGRYTMFSEALLHVLENGHPGEAPFLSIDALGYLTRTYLKEKYGENAVRPEVHCPDQREGDVTRMPLFQNPAVTCETPGGAQLAGLDESAFIEELLYERFYNYNIVLLLGQAEREQRSSREKLAALAANRYGTQNMIRVTPLFGEDVRPRTG